MILLNGVLFLVELVLVIYCVLSVITTPADQVRHLPKLVWLVLVVLLPIVGGIAWLLVGRPAGSRALPHRADRPSARPRGRTPAKAPDDDEDFLRSLRERAARQRLDAERAAREEQRRREGGTPPEA